MPPLRCPCITAASPSPRRMPSSTMPRLSTPSCPLTFASLAGQTSATTSRPDSLARPASTATTSRAAILTSKVG